MEVIPSQYTDLFQHDVVGIVATLLPDGRPHQTPVWIDYDGEYVLLNTVRGRRKEKNVRKHPAVSVCVTDPEDPYRFVTVRGEVVEVTSDGARKHADSLARRYLGVEEYPSHGNEKGERVILKIRADDVHASTRSERKDERENADE